LDPVRQIADAVLYEGYILWPYRRSALKNQRRWGFGGVYPRGVDGERAAMRVECLLEAGDNASVTVTVRFLQVVQRDVVSAEGEPVTELVVGGERHLTWDEAVEREFALPPVRLGASVRVPIAIPAEASTESLGDAGAIVRRWAALAGRIDCGVERVDAGLQRVTLTVTNTADAGDRDRQGLLARTFCSTHAVLRADGGAFVSLAEPPERLRGAAAACRNDGAWPVPVGEADDFTTVLASPIILEDHPRIAPESPGDLFDGGEIDQMLVLNILSLTDEEKAEMRASDPRAREILERTEALTPDELMRLHGAIREFAEVRR
jgi:hydrogenase maturation protease